MKLQGLSSVIAVAVSAALVGGAVAYGQDPLTAVEAVPVAPVMLVAPGPVAYPTSTVSPSESMAYRLEGWSFDEASESLDPYSAPTPQIVPVDGPRAVEPPPPPPPKTIAKETAIGSVGQRAANAVLSTPVNGRRTSVFGMRYHPILHVWKLHTGLDFAAPCGTAVGAAAAGRVVSTGWAGGNGVQVKIDHGMIAGYRVVTTYNHLSAVGVRAGQQVDALDGVGRVGNTGYSTGCHLHFEVIVDGRFTDPAPWLNGQPSRVELRDIAFLDASGAVTTPTNILGLAPSSESSQVPSESVWDSLLEVLSPSPSLSPSASLSSILSLSPSPRLSDSPSPSISPSPSLSPSVGEPSASETPPLVPSTTVPEPTSQAPAPEPTTQAPAPTTQAPAPTTQAPEPTTQAPAPTTQAPEPTTQAPAPTTQAPAPTTQAPEPTTQAPPPPADPSDASSTP